MIMRIWKKKALSALKPEGISPLAYPGCMRWQVVLLLPPGPVASTSQVIPPAPPPPFPRISSGFPKILRTHFTQPLYEPDYKIMYYLHKSSC